MSRRLAHRPHHHFTRATPRPLRQSQRDYLRQRWRYRQSGVFYPKHPPGYRLSLVPWGWKLTQPEIRWRA